MAYSYIQYTGNGSTTNFTVTFQYVSQADVFVTVDGNPSTFTWLNASTVVITPPPPVSTKVRIARKTKSDARIVDFVDGSVLTEADLDKSNEQVFYMAQEAFERADEVVVDFEDYTEQARVYANRAFQSERLAFDHKENTDDSKDQANIYKNLAGTYADQAQVAATAAEASKTATTNFRQNLTVSVTPLASGAQPTVAYNPTAISIALGIPVGATGAKGDKGDTGAAGSNGTNGINGTNGSNGAPGAKGDTGSGLQLKGSVANVGSLPATGNTSGDSYLINSVLYVWSGTEWINAGTVQGAAGATGATGAKGDKGDKGDTGNAGANGLDAVVDNISVITAIGYTPVNPTALATVATTGVYSDLTGKPTLFSGAYTDLTGKPTIPTVPTVVSAFTNDSGYLVSSALTPYLTTSTAASTYQTQSSMSTYATTSSLSSYLTTSSAASTYLALAGGSLTGGLKEARVAMGASDINLNAGNYFTRTISGATTLTVSNVPATGTAQSFILDLTNGGAAAVTFFSGVKWAGGTAPTLTAAGRDVLGFFTHDGGTTWSGLVLAKDIK